MKKYFIASLFLSSCLIFSTIQLQAKTTPQVFAMGTIDFSLAIEKTSNEQEVLLSINQYITEHLEALPELMSYYNADLEFTISLQITEQGYIEQLSSSAPCKSPIASALIQELEKLEKVAPIIEEGRAVERQYRIPIRLTR